MVLANYDQFIKKYYNLVSYVEPVDFSPSPVINHSLPAPTANGNIIDHFHLFCLFGNQPVEKVKPFILSNSVSSKEL